MFYTIAELHEKKQPFAVIVSHEIIGTIYSKVYKNNYLLVEEMSGSEINYFSDIGYMPKSVQLGEMSRPSQRYFYFVESENEKSYFSFKFKWRKSGFD